MEPITGRGEGGGGGGEEGGFCVSSSVDPDDEVVLFLWRWRNMYIRRGRYEISYSPVCEESLKEGFIMSGGGRVEAIVVGAEFPR